MRHIVGMLGAAVALNALLCTAANAQEQGVNYFSERINAPSNAFELKLGTGYTQGFGNLAPGRTLPDAAGPGIGGSVDLDYRISDHWSLGVEGQYQELQNQQNASARGLAGSLGGTYHFAPVRRGDPWVRLGSGYRLLWENAPFGGTGVNPPTVFRHGFDIIGAKVGYDIRMNEDVAIAPVIGADLNTFLWEGSTGNQSRALSSAQVGTFIYAGLQARFDLGGTRSGGPSTVAAIPMTTPGPTPPPPPEAPPPASAPPPPAAEATPAGPSIAVSEDIKRECNLDLGAIDKSPKFDFNQSYLLPADYAVLNQIGACFSTGPMKGQNLTLVGRADPRGTVAYNEQLGMKRAKDVGDYLQSLGVQAQQLQQMSRGKLDATGHDESSWAIDRRVDIIQR